MQTCGRHRIYGADMVRMLWMRWNADAWSDDRSKMTMTMAPTEQAAMATPAITSAPLASVGAGGGIVSSAAHAQVGKVMAARGSIAAARRPH